MISIKGASMKKITPLLVIIAIGLTLGGGATVSGRQAAQTEVQEQIQALTSADPIERAAAACALGRMRERAAPAIPHLIALLGDGTPIPPLRSCGNEEPFEDEEWEPRYEEVYEPSPGEAATHALMAIGGPALGALKQTLLGSNWRARKNAAWALAHRGDAVKELTLALQDPAWQVRAQAAYALFQRGGASREVIEALLAATQDKAWQVREQAVFALGHKGSGPVDVVPPLINLLKDDRAEIRHGAALALWHNADGRAFAPLMSALKDEREKVREQAAETLGNRAGDREVQLLIEARNDPDPKVRAGVRRALAVIKHRMQGRVTSLRRVPIPD
jgi:HEAT repeat protein